MSIHHSLLDCRHSVTSSDKLFLLWLLCHVRLWHSSTSEPKETLPSLFCWDILSHQEKNTQWPSVMELSNNVYITNYLYCWKTILNFYLNVCLKEMATHSSDKNTGDWTQFHVCPSSILPNEQHMKHSSVFDDKTVLKLVGQLLNLQFFYVSDLSN